jgi:PPP family 3-phenylpropionic acid transporter
MRSPRSLPGVPTASRHALLYATQFFAFGVLLPFLPAVLAARGLDAAEIAVVLAAGSVVRVFAGPVGGRLADALAAPRIVLALGAAAAALASAGLVLAAGFVALLLVNALMSLAMAPIVPLSDAVAVQASRREGFDYGRVRSAGSVAFICAALLAGQVASRAGVEATVALVMAGLAATTGAALLLPPAQASGVPARGMAGFLAPLRGAAFRRLVLVSALIQGSHGFYYAFSTLHWQAAGLDDGLIGALWATGVIAEIALFFWARGAALRVGAVGLCVIAGGAGVLRWGALALTTDPWLLFPLQILHAATFGAQHLAAMVVLGRIAPPGQAGTAQALHAAVGVTLATGAFTLVAGPLYAAFAGGGYWAMALLCAAAVPASLALGRALKG